MNGTRPKWEAILVALATAAFQWPFFDRWWSAMDEGHMLAFADLVANGGMLYRDATSYPLPGAFYLLALCFRLFEPSILLSRWVVLVEFSLFVALLFLLLRRLVPLSWALAGVLLLWLYRGWAFPHWQIYSYSTTALLLYAASLLLLVRFLETESRRDLALSGLLFGLGVFCKQDYGAAVLVATGATLAVHARGSGGAVRLLPSAAWFLGPAAAVGAAAGIHFFSQGQLGFVVQLTVLNHFIGLSSYDYPAIPSLLPLFTQDPQLREIAGIHQWVPGLLVSAGEDWKTVLASPVYQETALYDTAVKAFIYGPPVLLVAAGVWLHRRRASLPRAELALYGVACAFGALCLVYRPQDYVHLAVLTWPLLCLGVVWTHALLAERRAVAAALALVLLAPATAITARLLWQVRTLHSTLIPGERAGVYAKPEQARMLGEIVDHVRARSKDGETVAAMPYFPIVQFLAERRGPHAASYIVWPFPEYPDRDQRVIDAMEAAGTSLVIWNFTQFPTFPPVADYAPELFTYLVENFEIERVFGDEPLGYRVAALRRAGEPAGRALLGDPSIDVEVRLEGSRGRRIVPPDRRDRFADAEVWPFRRVLALRPMAGGRTVLSFPLRVPAGARLATAVGVHPDLWFRFPSSSVRFEIGVRDGADGTVTLFERTLDPQQELADRGWFDVEVPLDEWAGRTVTLELSTSATLATGESLRMGGFAEPRLVP